MIHSTETEQTKFVESSRISSKFSTFRYTHDSDYLGFVTLTPPETGRPQVPYASPNSLHIPVDDSADKLQAQRFGGTSLRCGSIDSELIDLIESAQIHGELPLSSGESMYMEGWSCGFFLFD